MIKRTRPYRTYRIVEKGRSKVISTTDDKSIWELLKKYINEAPIDDILQRTSIIHSIYKFHQKYIPYNTIDGYLYNLRAVKVLETVNPGRYKKLRNIPIKLTTSQLRKISNKNSWESWFITIDHI